jgi:DNA-binding response OmpR family regulator
VDDERVIADTLAAILRQAGFDASAVYTGTAAIERARRTCPDLVITDVVMSDVNGVQVATRIKGLLPSCKILLFSGRADTADELREAAEQDGEFHLLLKPVHPQDLIRRIGEELRAASADRLKKAG